MVIIGLLGIVFAIAGFFSGLEYGQFEAWLFAAPGISVNGYALLRLMKDIERLKSEAETETNGQDR